MNGLRWLWELPRDVTISCGYAARGVIFALRSQRNFRIHMIAGGVVLLAGWWLQVTRWEMTILILTVSLVIMGELLNTGLELTLNLLEARNHPVARAAKDVAAGGVIMAVLGSVAVGLLIFGPRLIHAMRCL